MDFLIPAFIGIIIGGLAAYFYFGRDVKKPVPVPVPVPVPGPEPEPGGIAVVEDLVKNAHYAAFGPIGIPKEAQDAEFNKLWKWAGKSESGMPRA